MKYITEYRSSTEAKKLVALIKQRVTKPWTIMEICGGQTHTIVKFGIDGLLPKNITLIHGPGCPVCVTPLEIIDKALAIASKPNVIFTSYGDMLRVPGSKKDLLTIKAEGGDVHIVYSPIDALNIAKQNPGKEVVFFGVGFETTAPANAMAVHQAKQSELKNFSLLSSHVLVPPAIEAILSSQGTNIQGFLAAGHVCTVMGYEEYIPIAQKYRVPIVVTGFEPIDILQGLLMCIGQLESGNYEVINQYSRVVRLEGNVPAKNLIFKVFEPTDRNWRGIGMIPNSGYKLRPEYIDYDAVIKFNVGEIIAEESKLCIAGHILQGMKKPHDCPAFGTQCTPEHPLGAPMVSSEGACAAYYHYGRNKL